MHRRHPVEVAIAGSPTFSPRRSATIIGWSWDLRQFVPPLAVLRRAIFMRPTAGSVGRDGPGRRLSTPGRHEKLLVSTRDFSVKRALRPWLEVKENGAWSWRQRAPRAFIED